MGIFSPDFVSVDASIPIYEKARYRVKVTKKTPVVKEKNENNVITEQAGVRYALEMVGRFDEKGELVTTDLQGRVVTPLTCWVHNDGGWKFSKPFIMAASGYNVRNEEELANKELFQGHTWIVNGSKDSAPENIELGSGWDRPIGRLVDVTLTKKVKPNEADPEHPFENQDYGSWSPVK